MTFLYHRAWYFTATWLLSGCTKKSPDSRPTAQLEKDTEEISGDSNLLTREARQYVWDVEHLAFVVEQKVLGNLKRALATARSWPLSSRRSFRRKSLSRRGKTKSTSVT